MQNIVLAASFEAAQKVVGKTSTYASAAVIIKPISLDESGTHYVTNADCYPHLTVKLTIDSKSRFPWKIENLRTDVNINTDIRKANRIMDCLVKLEKQVSETNQLSPSPSFGNWGGQLAQMMNINKFQVQDDCPESVDVSTFETWVNSKVNELHSSCLFLAGMNDEVMVTTNAPEFLDLPGVLSMPIVQSQSSRHVRFRRIEDSPQMARYIIPGFEVIRLNNQ